MIHAQDFQMRIGPRVLLDPVTLTVDRGKRIGLVGRNGAGKTTLLRLFAREDNAHNVVEYDGQIHRRDTIGYLPQDPRATDAQQIARERVLSARGIEQMIRRIKRAEWEMSNLTGPKQNKAMERYVRLDAEFTAAGGWAAHAEAARITAALGLPERVLDQELGTLSGGQRRRIELARVLFSGAQTLLLDEPTNHLDHDSIVWLREWLRSYSGGCVIVSHDVELLRETVNTVWYFDAIRHTIDIYSMNWERYLLQRDADERRRRRERANAEKKAAALHAQAEKMRYKATKAVAAQNMDRRAERLLAQTEEDRTQERIAQLRFPDPAPCGKLPLSAEGLTKTYGSLEVFAGVDLAIDRGSRVVVLGLNGAGKTTLLRLLSGVESPDAGVVHQGHGLKLGYYAQEHEFIDPQATVMENMRRAAPDTLDDTGVRTVLGSFLFTGDDVDKPAGVLSGGEKTRLALATLVVSAANVLLLDEPTNNLDPASREKILGALRRYTGAVVLVTHDEGAVRALNPDRVLLLPDGDEDLWSEDYQELICLA
ncbi:ABC-F family ATP-binding cassette domain-containing protein [Trueperella sp. LYQ143]|uniref:ABC-F family ATP-binding cassette domain-containing protein n=1 Tax=unclassified Trueperella TaxID=2630174 RepID=UPI0039837E60